jgi:hypothetical protein
MQHHSSSPPRRQPPTETFQVSPEIRRPEYRSPIPLLTSVVAAQNIPNHSEVLTTLTPLLDVR